MKKYLLFVLAISPILAFSQTVNGSFYGGKPSITQITIISRGDDRLGLGDDFKREFAMRGVDVFAQTKIGQNTEINSETVNSKYAMTFSYVVNGYGMLYKTNVDIIDIENDGKVIGNFTYSGMKGRKKVVPKFVDTILK